MAFTPTTGQAGRVKSGSATVAGITSWRVSKQAGSIDVTSFESSANSDSIVFRDKLVGLAEWTVEVEGIYDLDNTTSTETGTPALRIGKTVTLDLVASKGSSLGYDTVTGFITAFSTGLNINNQAMTFQLTLTGTGTFPAFGTIS